MFYAGRTKVREHRMVMEQKLGRPLFPYEVVHHINGSKAGNRPENLRVLIRQKHNSGYAFGYQEGFEAGYNKAKEEINVMS